MIQQAIASDDPIIFFEPKRRYWEKGEVDTSDALAERTRCTPRGWSGPGTDATVRRVRADGAHRAGRRHRRRRGRARRWRSSTCARSRRWTWPRSTSRCAAPAALVVVHEAPGNLGLGAEIAARVTEECFYSLEAPVLRVTGFDTPYPAARVEEEYLPDLDRVLDAVDRSFGLVTPQ